MVVLDCTKPFVPERVFAPDPEPAWEEPEVVFRGVDAPYTTHRPASRVRIAAGVLAIGLLLWIAYDPSAVDPWHATIALFFAGVMLTSCGSV